MYHRLPRLFILLLIANYIAAQPAVSPLRQSFQEYKDHRDTSRFGLEWVPLGPVLNSARVEAVQLDPEHPGTMYVAFGSGNLWKTTDNGLHWRPLFENQAAQGIGDFALAPSNPDIIYLGTGESLRKNRNFTMPGDGVYRSDDGGDTWRHLGLTDAWHTGEIIVHPEDPDRVYVAVLGRFWSRSSSRGIYRTEDGGKTWEHTLYVNDQTGGNDIVIAPSNPTVLYASMWEFNPDTTLAAGVGGPNSGVFRSADGGKTWQAVNHGLPRGPQTGRIGLAVSHQNEDVAYAFVDNRNKPNLAEAAEVYQTTNGGQSWQKTHQAPLLNLNTIGWYFTDIYVNPQDEEEIFALGVRIAHSKDGGKTFTQLNGAVTHLHPSPAQTLHLDHCEMWINPLNPNHLALGNDGGFYVSYDRGQNWLHYNNIPAGEFYDITTDRQEPYRIFGGVQDDATVYGPAREWDDRFPDPWRYLWIDAWSGGDGCVTQVDPTDPNTVYFSMQNGYALRKDLRADTSKVIAPSARNGVPPDLTYQFVTPYFISAHQAQTLYHAGNYVYKTTNRGDDWRRISPNLSDSKYPEKKSLAAGALAESPLKPGLLYFGSDRGAVWVSQNDGQDWEEHSDSIANYYIRSICPSRHAEARVYLVQNGLNYDELGAYLYQSEDYGKTWTSIRGNLPHETANVILEDPMDENILYAGLYRGVYISLDRGRSWSLLGTGMPNVSVADLEIREKERELIAGTHGRGIYKIDLRPLYQAIAMGLPLDKDYLFAIPQVATPRRRDTHRDIDLQSVEKAAFTFWLEKAGGVQIRLLDKNGRESWRTGFSGKRGFNQLRWNQVVKENTSQEPYFIKYQEYLAPGEYQVIVETAQGELRGSWRVAGGG